MTEENFNYRTDPMFLRNQFYEYGKYRMPMVPLFDFDSDELDGLRLIGFDVVKSGKDKHLDRMVHFFLYDYKFECIWKKPDKYIDILRKYKAVLTPDFSMYTDMATQLQMYNTFRNRWCGAYLASKGIRVIPTVSWGEKNTFDFCFEGIQSGSTVAVSTYMVSEHNNHADQKDLFMAGYNEMLSRIDPQNIICYNTPFPEMEGNIIFVDYDLSSWRHYNDDQTGQKRMKNDIIIKKSGFVLREKGMGNSRGGAWRPSPNKPNDQRFIGKPGEKKIVYNRKGEKIETKIGEDGRAVIERHYSDHHNPKSHTNPHDHKINWDNPRGFPKPGKPINYPDGAPEFKNYRGANMKINYINLNDLDDSLNFETISSFKWCVEYGGEVEFEWKGKSYSITHPNGRINIGEGYYEKDGKFYNVLSHKECKEIEGLWGATADEILEYKVGEDRLRDVITKVKVIDRTI